MWLRLLLGMGMLVMHVIYTGSGSVVQSIKWAAERVGNIGPHWGHADVMLLEYKCIYPSCRKRERSTPSEYLMHTLFGLIDKSFMLFNASHARIQLRRFNDCTRTHSHTINHQIDL